VSANTKRAAILISGRGSNMEKLVEAAAAPGFPARIDLVLSDRPDAAGLALAQRRGIATSVARRADFPSRLAHDEAINAELQRANVELVCLAGYMRLLSSQFVEAWLGRMINIHPALLPSFKGLNTHARALEAGVRIHGCTVHFVTAETDGGPIIAQAAVPVLGRDTAQSLAARVLKAEHRLYAPALELVASGQVRMEDGRAVFADDEAESGAVLVAPAARAGPADLERLARLTP
jgi:phosphoribosylglycinamide formyltransferase 1